MSADAWLRSGLKEVELPSGFKVRGLLPTLARLARDELLPTELASTAAAFARPEWHTEPHDDPDERRRLNELLRVLTAALPSEIWNAELEAWQPVTITPADYHRLDPNDWDLLEDIALRRKTAEQVTAVSRRIRGDLTESEASAIVEKEAPATTEGWRPFRGEPGSAPGGADGEGVGEPPVAAARGRGRGRRVRPGRGARDA